MQIAIGGNGDDVRDVKVGRDQERRGLNAEMK